MKFIFISLLSICWLATCSHASTNPYVGLTVSSKDSLIRCRIDSIRKHFQNIGLYAIAVNNSRIVYSKSFGFSDTLIKDSIRGHDLFLIASVSKTFVGTAIMQLVEKKKISLDDDVNKYLDYSVRNPKFPQTPITIKMLLCHRSGLKRSSPYSGNFIDVLIDGKKDKLEKLFEEFHPGDGFSYSNMGFDILGAVIEKATGIRFDEYVDNNILKPLKIYGGYDISRLDTSRFVRTYSYKDGKFRKLSTVYSKEVIKDYKLGYSINKLWPAGGMVISANDLAEFMIAHMNKGKIKGKKRILSSHGEESLWGRKFGANHGLSFVHFKGILPEIDLIGMSGGARGIHSYMLFEPNEKFGFVVICNGCTSKSADGSDMNKLIIRELYNAYIDCK